MKIFDCFVEWCLKPAVFCLFEESPIELAMNVCAKICFGSAFVWQLLTVRFHCFDDRLQVLVAGVVETSFASSQENVVEVGFDNGGERKGSETIGGGNR